MKKIIYSAMAVAMLATTSCKDDFAESFVGEEATVEFSISTPEIGTRAYSDGSTATVLQYAIYDEAGNELTALTHSVTNENAEEIKGSAKISLQLKNNKSYQMVVWAAAPNAPYTINFEDKTMTVNYTGANSNDENRDAFYAYQEFTVDQNTTIDVKLKRPFAQLNIGAGDFTQSANSGYTPTKSYVKVPAYSTLNFADGSVDGQDVREFALNTIPVDEDFPYDPDKTDAVKPYRYLAMNYILVGADQELVDIEFGHSNDNEGDTRTIGSVPVQRNYRTNIYGNILTSATDINVQIVPDYTGENNEKAPEYVNVATAQDLIDAVNGTEAPDNLVVTLTDNIDLSDLFGPNLAPTRAGNIEPTYYVALANGKELTIDLNGCKLSAEENSQKSFALIQNNGTLTIKDSKGEGVIKFTAKNNREWNAYSSVISNQPGGKLIVEGGTIEHLGGTDMAYAIDNLTNGKGTYAETIINGGYVKSTYRAVRQFLNGVEAQNILTVNGGKIEGANKSIWMQDPSKNANTGELFVAADAELYGDVYLYVTEDSTEWPVEVQIAEAALKGESKVLTGNVPKGYSVIEENGVWKVINAVAVTTADELVAELGKGYNVYFMNDIKIDSTNLSNGYGATGISQLNGGVIDGNGKKLSVNAWGTWDSALNTTGGIIKNLNVTGGMRGIFVNHNSTNNSKVILDNVVIDGTVYTISCDQGTNQGLEATNSTFNGWTSYAATIGEVLFTNCSFGKGQGYAFCRPYAPTKFVGCNFEAGYEIDARAAVTFENCKINGVALTAENLATLVTSNTANATVK